jgi:predicted metalloenzyme YecM
MNLVSYPQLIVHYLLTNSLLQTEFRWMAHITPTHPLLQAPTGSRSPLEIYTISPIKNQERLAMPTTTLDLHRTCVKEHP